MKLSRFLFSVKKTGFFISKADINPCVMNAQYAVRGEVPTKAGQIEEEIKQNPQKNPYPFK